MRNWVGVVIAVLAFGLVAPGCKSKEEKQAERQAEKEERRKEKEAAKFEKQGHRLEKHISAESPTFKILITDVRHLPKSMRIDLTLENKLDKTVTMSWGGFQFWVGEEMFPGAMHVGVVRTEKDFDMAPKMVKHPAGPIEARNVPMTANEVTLKLTGVRAGTDRIPDPAIEVKIPLKPHEED